MNQYVLEIVRQKWRFLSVILFLLLLNVTLGIIVSQYQIPSLANLQTQWSTLRQQTTSSGHVDATTLHRQGGADLETLKARIPEKKEFARVLSDLIEAAASSNVAVGGITYKPVQFKEENLLSYQLTLSVNGSYAAVKSFLSDLQSNQGLLVVEPVSFTNSDPLVENVVMNLNITIYLRGGA
jgi:type IV pilus assembly protein PilO